MSEAVSASLGIAAYLALFFGVGLLFVLVNLLIGRFLRASDPHEEKVETYECGEPTIGSSFLQFDLRFYVVALLFIIFEVEVAFFFPWATVFGKATHMMDKDFPVVRGSAGQLALTADAAALYQELGVRQPGLPGGIPPSLEGRVAAGPDQQEQVIREGSRQLALLSLIDIAVFFGVLLVGFAYVWKRGDLDWVRAITGERMERSERAPAERAAADQPALTA